MTTPPFNEVFATQLEKEDPLTQEFLDEQPPEAQKDYFGEPFEVGDVVFHAMLYTFATDDNEYRIPEVVCLTEASAKKLLQEDQYDYGGFVGLGRYRLIGEFIPKFFERVK